MAVQTITYGDKSYLNENANIPATNKVQDTDMNEIKSVVNNNATETSTNTTNIANITGTILWTNPNPTNSIDSDTTITLDNSNYDIILWLVRYSSSVSEIISSHSIKGYGTKVSNILNDGSTLRYREIAYVSDTSYTIKGTSNGGALIPMYAIGYKTGLFS